MGDNRSPLWRHGGTVHGPEPRSYAWKQPKKMRRNALRSALAQKLREGKLVCLENLDPGSHKTGELEKVVNGGGFAIVPPDQQLLDGNLAVFVDPNGGVTGIVKWDYAEAGE